MKRLTLTAIVLLILAPALPASADTRTLFESVAAEGLTQVNISAGVGDVEVLVGTDSEVHAEVILKPRWGGLFSSRKRAQSDVETATLRAKIIRGTLHLEIDSDSRNRKFEEQWTVMMPRALTLDLENGVGDATVRGLSGGVRVEAGVGNVLVETTDGDVSVEVGVGDADVTAPLTAAGLVECASGVGRASVMTNGRKHSSSGFVGNSAEWRGDGEASIDVEVGVGESTVTLRKAR